MAEVIWTVPALSDLDTIADYIALHNPHCCRRSSQGPPALATMSASSRSTESAVIWPRTDQPAYMHVLVEGSRNGAHAVVKVNTDGDYTGKARVTGLKAGRSMATR